VLAVADATVVQAVDGFADQVPNAPEPVTIAEADGNYVILKVDDGVYAFYAHLAPGSVRVQPGDTVRAGDVIGRTGNSGSSTGPHLHFHVMDRPSALRSNGLPYVFDRFTLTGRTPPLEELMRSNPETDPVPVDTADAGRRRDQLPQGRDVVAFASP
jgi:murein DD-endopeptidase MepM/ murein hydrolase activator NlpD